MAISIIISGERDFAAKFGVTIVFGDKRKCNHPLIITDMYNSIRDQISCLCYLFLNIVYVSVVVMDVKWRRQLKSRRGCCK
jgi:hypothetical protein